jgi:serine/threonine protein kinase
MIEEEEDKFLKENPVVFKKYKVKKKLGEGAFGDVYLGQAIENNQYVAMKVEARKIAKPILESEAFLLYSIAGLGIPEVKSFGKVKNYTVLVEPLLGKSLFDIFAENHKEMPLEDVCLIGKQVIDRIQWVHSKYIVHRDIKPDNFLIGKKDPNVIYIIDFGLSKKYRSSATNKHIRFGFTGKLTGTVRFASANALRGGEQSRRDDIESIGYMLVYFMKKRLPWQGVTGTRKMERYLKIYKMKKNTTPEELCSGLPPEMTEYIKYAKHLEFEQQPDYKYLKKLFGKMLKRIHNTNDQLVFSWIKLTDLPNLKNPVNPATRKDSPQSRIYKKIKSSLERERNMSSDSDSKHSYQQVFTQANQPSNLKVINKNAPDSEVDQNTEKKLENQ